MRINSIQWKLYRRCAGFGQSHPPEQNTILAKKASIIADPTSMILTLRLENGSIHTVSSILKSIAKLILKITILILTYRRKLILQKINPRPKMK